MLKTYYLDISNIVNDTCVFSSRIFCIKEENKAVSESIEYNWDTIEEFSSNYSSVFVWTFITNRIRGKRAVFYTSDSRYVIKSWRTELTGLIKYEYTETTASIEKILDYSDGITAIKYLRQNGLNICPKT